MEGHDLTRPSEALGGLRAHRLFDRSSRRSFMVAIDRPLMAGADPGGASIREMVTRATEAQPDGIVLSAGALKQSADLLGYRGAPSPVVRLDFILVGDVARGSGEHHRLICNVEDAVSLGADAVIMFLVDGFPDGAVFADCVERVASVVPRAQTLGLPVIVEAVAWGSSAPSDRDPQRLSFICRVAAELGADIVKTPYTGDVDTMNAVISACSVPVLALGGPRIDDRDELLAYTGGALAAGAAGVVFGRNVYLNDDRDTVAAVRHAVHANGNTPHRFTAPSIA